MNGPLKIMTALFAVALFAVPAVAMVSAADTDEPIPDPNKFVSYYAQLDANGKAIYDIVEAAAPDLTTLKLELPVIVTAKADDRETAVAYVTAAVKRSMDDAFIALRLSSPRAYLVWEPTAVIPAYSVTVSGDTATISYVTLDIHYLNYPVDPATGTFQGIQKMLDDLDAAADKFTTNGKTDFEKVSDINKYLIDLVTYDPNYRQLDASGKPLESPYCHIAYGALIKPNYAVCDGYSKAFLLLCQKTEIECVVAQGSALPGREPHAWNYVKVDEKWYGMDVTWNDTNNNEYFLRGTDFFTTHVQGIYLHNGLTTDRFSIPAINSTPYGTGPPEWYLEYAWVLAIVIVSLIMVALYMFSRRGRPTK
jgi:hypothetical protein